MKYVEIRLIGGGRYVQSLGTLSVLIDELREGEIGDQWELEIIEMDEEEYKALPKFVGH